MDSIMPKQGEQCLTYSICAGNQQYRRIQVVPELADQIETVYSLMVMKLKNV
jgi:hypothetical protein